MITYKISNLSVHVHRDYNLEDYAGECYGEINPEHMEEFREWMKECSEDSAEEISEEIHNADLIIFYMTYLMELDGPQECHVYYNNYFWGIHDAQHAMYDTSGCSLYVDGYVEEHHLRAAFIEMQKMDLEISYELVAEVEKALYDRWKLRASFEEYCSDFEVEEEEEEEELLEVEDD